MRQCLQPGLKAVSSNAMVSVLPAGGTAVEPAQPTEPTEPTSPDLAIIPLADGILSVRVGSLYNYGHALTVLEDGRLLVAGQSNGNGSTRMEYSVVQLQPNGALDTSFGDAGKARVALEFGSENYAVEVQEDGKVVASGAYNYSPYQGRWDYLVTRLDENGQPDVTFTGGLEQPQALAFL